MTQSWADRARAKPANPIPSESASASTQPRSVDHRLPKSATTTSRSSTATNTPCFTSTAPSTPASSAQEPLQILNLHESDPDDQLRISQLNQLHPIVNDHPNLANAHEKFTGHPNTSPTQTPDHKPDSPSITKTPSGTAVNIWQARKVEMSKRYNTASRPSNNSTLAAAPEQRPLIETSSVIDATHSPVLPALPVIADTSDWPAPSEESRSTASVTRRKSSVLPPALASDDVNHKVLQPEHASEQGKKLIGGKKIQWKPIKADITHNAPLPTNHSASMRAQRSHRKESLHSTSNRSSQPQKQSHTSGSTLKTSKVPYSGSDDPAYMTIDKVSKSSTEEFDKSRIRSELTRQTAPTPSRTLYPDNHIGPSPYLLGVSPDVPGNTSCDTTIVSTPNVSTALLSGLPNHTSSSPALLTARPSKPGFIPRISPTIQPPAMELSAGLTTNKYIGVPLKFAPAEPVLSSSIVNRDQYELHVNAPQGNVWVNDPLVMSDGTSPVLIKPGDSARSAAMVLDGHLLDEPDAAQTPHRRSIPGSELDGTSISTAELPILRKTGIQGDASLAACKTPTKETVSSNRIASRAGSMSDFHDAPSEIINEPGDQTDVPRPRKFTPSYEGVPDKIQGARDRTTSNTRPSPPSVKVIAKELRPKDATVRSSRRTSAEDLKPASGSLPSHPYPSRGSPASNLWKEAPSRKAHSQSGKSGHNARPNHHGGGGKGAGGSRGNSWRSSSNGALPIPTYRPRGFSASERGSSGGRGNIPRYVEDPQGWYSHPAYPNPSNPYPTKYPAPANGHDPTASFGSPAYMPHPDSPSSNSTPTMSSSNVPVGVMGPIYPSSQSHQQNHGQQFYPPLLHSFSSPFPSHQVPTPQVDQPYQDPSTYYGMHPYYPSSQSPSTSIPDSRTSSAMASPPSKHAYPVFGNYDRPAPLLAYPYPLDPVQYYVLGQCEYYFSVENLVKDCFLRSHMDHEGWVKIEIISSFNRIKTLSTDPNVIKEVMSLSAFLEVDAERNLVRKKGDWSQWILPIPPMEPYPTVTPTAAHQAVVPPDSRQTPPNELLATPAQFPSPATTDNGSMQPTLSSETSDHSSSTHAFTNGRQVSGDTDESSISSLGGKEGYDGPNVSELEPLVEEIDLDDDEVKDASMSFDPVVTLSPNGGQPTISIGFDPSLGRPRQSHRQTASRRSTTR